MKAPIVKQQNIQYNTPNTKSFNSLRYTFSQNINYIQTPNLPINKFLKHNISIGGSTLTLKCTQSNVVAPSINSIFDPI